MLAIHGGTPTRTKPWGICPVFTDKDMSAIQSVISSNCFTGFRAGNYDGGPKVKELEDKISSHTGSKFAVSFDTWSNGLFAILLALGIQPGDEVILPGYTMTACASMVLACGAVPIFVDTEPDCCLSPAEVLAAITPKTQAIMVVHLFGFSAQMEELSRIAKEHDLWLIEDCAQSPKTFFNGKRCGTFGDVGGFSFTQNKHVMSGEGGCAITDNVQINNALRYIRNHGEVCTFQEIHQGFAHDMVVSGLPGFNFRMTEIAAAIASSQWDSLDSEVKHRQTLAEFLNSKIKDMPCLAPVSADLCRNSSYFLYPIKYNGSTPKSKICKALSVEGVNVLDGYCKPIYRQSLYSTSLAWPIRQFADLKNYYPSKFPITERLQYNELLVFPDVRSPNTLEDMQDIVNALSKVIEFYE